MLRQTSTSTRSPTPPPLAGQESDAIARAMAVPTYTHVSAISELRDSQRVPALDDEEGFTGLIQHA